MNEKPGRYPSNPFSPDRMQPRGVPAPLPASIDYPGEPVPLPPTPTGVPIDPRR